MVSVAARAEEGASRPVHSGVLYEERVPTGPTTRILLVLATATLIGAGWIATPGESLLARSFFRLFTLGAALVILAVGWRIHELRIEVTNKQITIRQGRFSRALPIEDIDHAEAAMASSKRVRVPGKGKLHEGILYITRQGPAVVLYREHAAPVAFSSTSPHGVVEAVDSAVRWKRSHTVRPALRENEVIVLEAV